MNMNDDLLMRLKLIGSMEPHKKFDVRGGTVHDEPSGFWSRFFTAVIRYIKGESRETTFDFIKGTLEEAITTLRRYVHELKQSDDIKANHIHILQENIKLAFGGIVNVIETYKDDITLKSKLEVQLTTRQRELELILLDINKLPLSDETRRQYVTETGKLILPSLPPPPPSHTKKEIK